MKKIAVCDNCLRASCFNGIFYCDNYKEAGVIFKTIAELKQLNLEHPDHWKSKASLNGLGPTYHRPPTSPSHKE